MNILFVHQNFPGQYRHLARGLHSAGHYCVAIGAHTASALPGILLKRVSYACGQSASGLHPWALDLHVKCFRAEAVARQVIGLLEEGFMPDLVIGHPGWGELLAIKDVLPGVPVLHQLEFVYQLTGADVGFDPEFGAAPYADPLIWDSAARLRLRRAPQLLALHDLDHAWSPTHWQASTAPSIFSDRITVIHEGIDTRQIRPDPQAQVRLRRADVRFRPGDELVTFVARSLEPYRGFHVFMRMLPLLQRLRPSCHVVIVGGDGVSYGSDPADARTWRQVLLSELHGQLDLDRVHFVGRIPHDLLHNLFQVSACHVYLTYPFVLSWSLLEAMSCGAVVVGSATPPVEEVIRDGENGFLVDFFDREAMAERVASVLESPAAHQRIGHAARCHVQSHYDLYDICLPAQFELVHRVAGRIV